MTLNTLEFLFQESWTSVRRNGIISAAAITNITAVLVVGGLFLLLSVNVDYWLGLQAAKASITLDLADDANPADIEAAMLADDRVVHTQFKTKDENLRELFKRQGWDLKTLKYVDNPLPNSLIVETARPEDVPDVAEKARSIKGVAGVHYAQELAHRLLKLVRGAKLTGAALSMILVAAALVVVATTIRLTIYARRREIRIMQLVGATHWFIRLPFLIEGAIYGTAAGVLAGVFLLAGYAYLEEQVSQALPFLQLVFGTKPLALLGLGILGAGLVLGTAGSVLATREHIREV